MAEKKGLGKGLGALLGMNDLGEEQPTTQKNRPIREIEEIQHGEGVVELSVRDIDPNREQPRKNFDEAALEELAESIRLHGVISPIVVTRVGLRYMIIAGERRWRASKLAGKETIPAVVRNYTSQQIKEISLIENLQREDLNPVEAARAIKELMDEFHMTQEAAADRIGKSRSAIANTLRLLTLDERVVAMIEQGKISAGHGRALVALRPEDQYRLAQKAVDGGWSVREMEKRVRDFTTPAQEEKPKPQQSLELRELVTNMQRVFATKVTALGNDQKGRIYIDYFSKDDLDRLCELIDAWRAER